RRIRRMSGVDHDRLAEFAANGSWRSLGRIRWAKHVANFAHCIGTLINNRDRFFCSRRVVFLRWTPTRLLARHKFHDALPVFATAFWTEFFLKDRQHRPVKL